MIGKNYIQEIEGFKNLNDLLCENVKSQSEREKIKSKVICKDNLEEYLDNAIENWRKNKEKAKNEEDELVAACYVDAYQSVRKSFLGELKD